MLFFKSVSIVLRKLNLREYRKVNSYHRSTLPAKKVRCRKALGDRSGKLRSPDEGREGDRQWQLKHTRSCPRPAPTRGCIAHRRHGSEKPMRTKDQTTLLKALTIMRLASTN